MTYRPHLFISALAIGSLTTLLLAVPGCGSSANSNGADGGTGGAGGAGGHACSTGGTSGAVDDAGVMCTPQYSHTFGFGAIYEGWGVALYSTPSLIPIPASGGLPASGTTVELDNTDGAPGSANGSLKLSIPFDSTGQLLLLANVLSPSVNLTGTRITAQIKLDSGVIVGPSDTVRAYFVLKSTSAYNYLPAQGVVLDPSAGWQTLTIDGDMPNADAVGIGYAPCDVREIDIEIRTGDQGMYKAGVIKVDQIAITPKSCL